VNILEEESDEHADESEGGPSAIGDGGVGWRRDGGARTGRTGGSLGSSRTCGGGGTIAGGSRGTGAVWGRNDAGAVWGGNDDRGRRAHGGGESDGDPSDDARDRVAGRANTVGRRAHGRIGWNAPARGGWCCRNVGANGRRGGILRRRGGARGTVGARRRGGRIRGSGGGVESSTVGDSSGRKDSEGGGELHLEMRGWNDCVG